MWTIFRKDLAIERRTGEILSSLLLLALLVVLVFAFTLELERLREPGLLGGLLWATLLLAGTLALGRSMLLEREAGAWTALALAPIDRGSVFLGKAAANLLLLLIAAALVLPVMAILLGTSRLAPSPLLGLAILLGTTGMAAVGTLGAALASRTRAREVLLPILTFPLLVPLLIAVARVTSAGLVGEAPAAVRPWLVLLCVFDLVFLTVGWLTFDHVLED